MLDGTDMNENKNDKLDETLKTSVSKTPDSEEPKQPEHHSWWTRKRKIGVGIAAAAVACGLVAIVITAQPVAQAQTDTKPTESIQQVTEKETDFSEDDVEAVAESDLSYAGTDVTADVGTAQVTADNGHIMVTQSSDNNASERVDYAAKRSAATMAKVSDDYVTVKGSKPTDVTWVMCDTEGTPKVAVRVTPDSESTKAATDETADSSTQSAVTGSDGWSMSEDTHDALDDPDVIPETGSNVPTKPDGTDIVPPTKNVDEGNTEQSSNNEEGNTENNSADTGSDNSSSNDTPAPAPSNNTPAPSGDSQQPAHTHTWEPIYQTKWVQDSAAWDEPIYSSTVKVRCQACGALFDTLDEYEDHDEDVHNMNSSYSSQRVTTQTGTKHHDATGHYEQVVTGYRCLGCGATK